MATDMHTEAIILSVRPAREYDRLVSCYTHDAGRLFAVARGACRPGSVQGMHLDRGNLVRFELVPARGTPVITGAQTLDAFSSVKRDLNRLAASWVVFESVETLVAGSERDDVLWDVLLAALRQLGACSRPDILPVLRRVQLSLLEASGYAPRMNGCALCGARTNDAVSFSVHLGGVVCESCARSGWYGSRLDSADVAWLAGRTGNAPCAGAYRRAPTEELLEHIAGHRLRSVDLLLRLASM